MHLKKRWRSQSELLTNQQDYLQTLLQRAKEINATGCYAKQKIWSSKSSHHQKLKKINTRTSWKIKTRKDWSTLSSLMKPKRNVALKKKNERRRRDWKILKTLKTQANWKVKIDSTEILKRCKSNWWSWKQKNCWWSNERRSFKMKCFKDESQNDYIPWSCLKIERNAETLVKAFCTPIYIYI